jgi:hypothetical protein|mmetsp:Transcript_17682/g.17019  ORF Transcript_17682/g.17019 Transcript_17682/m.17019 type:complete len:82 (-) Transcript_17682:359-604(-)
MSLSIYFTEQKQNLLLYTDPHLLSKQTNKSKLSFKKSHEKMSSIPRLLNFPSLYQGVLGKYIPSNTHLIREKRAIKECNLH